MSHRIVSISLCLFAAAGLAFAQECVEQPASAADVQPASAPAGVADPAPADPVVAASAPAPTPAATPEAMELLELLESAGQRYQSLRADLSYHVLMKQLGDQELRKGYVAYLNPQGDEPGKFRVHFDSLRLGEGKPIKEVEDYAFDGHYLVMAKHKIKEMTFVQVTAEGERAQPMKLGEGPFPLPFGQNVQDVLTRFDATTKGATEGPAGTRYLRLVPKPEQAEQASFTRLEMWIDPQTALPARLVSEDPSRNVTTVDFTNIKTDPKLEDNTFDIKWGQFGAGWQRDIRRLEDMETLEP